MVFKSTIRAAPEPQEVPKPKSANHKSSMNYTYCWFCCKCQKSNGTESWINNPPCRDCKHDCCFDCQEEYTTKREPTVVEPPRNWWCCQCNGYVDVWKDEKKKCKCKHAHCDYCADV